MEVVLLSDEALVRGSLRKYEKIEEESRDIY